MRPTGCAEVAGLLIFARDAVASRKLHRRPTKDVEPWVRREWGCTYFKLDANFWGAMHGQAPVLWSTTAWLRERPRQRGGSGRPASFMTRTMS